MDGVIAQKVYAQLKAAVMSGVVSMHAQLDIADLAKRYDVSTTPIREAAMRLWGEGLLEPHHKGGLSATLATEARFRALVETNDRLVAASFAIGSRLGIDLASGTDKTAEAREREFFRAIIKRTSNAAMLDFVDRLNDRLALYRCRGPEVFVDLDEELGMLERSIEAPRELRHALKRYHRRRMAHAGELVLAATMVAGIARD